LEFAGVEVDNNFVKLMVQKRHVHLDHNGDADGSGGGVRGRGGVGCSNGDGDYYNDEMAMMDGGPNARGFAPRVPAPPLAQIRRGSRR
jgi:hypothetical protein